MPSNQLWETTNIIVAFCYVHKCELPYMCPAHDIKLHPTPSVGVTLYRIRCVGSGYIGEGANNRQVVSYSIR